MARIGKVEIDTQQATKSVKSLEGELKNTKKALDDIGNSKLNNVDNSLNNLSKTSDNTAKSVSQIGTELKNVNQYASELSLDKLLPKFSSIAGGIAGGFNTISTAVKLFGSDTDESNQAISELTALLQALPLQFIAITQGVSTFGGLLKDIFSSNILKYIDSFSKKISDLFRAFDNSNLDIFDLNSNIKNLESFVANVVNANSKFGESFDDLIPILDDVQDRINTYFREIKRLSKEMVSIIRKETRGEMKVDVGSLELQKIRTRKELLKNDTNEYFADLLNNLNKEGEKIKENTQNVLQELSVWEKLKIQVALVKAEMGAAFAPFTVGLGVIVAGITAITTGLIKLYKATKVAADEQKRLLTLMYDYGKSIPLKGLQDAATEYMNIDAAFRNAVTKTNGLGEQQKALERLNELVPEFKGKLNTLTGEIEGNTKALDNHIAKLKEEAQAQAAISAIVDLEKKRLNSEIDIQKYTDQLTELQKKIDTAHKEAIEATSTYSEGGVFINAVAAPYEREAKEVQKLLKNAKRDAKDYADQIEWIYKNLNTNVEKQQKNSDGDVVERPENIFKDVTERLKANYGTQSSTVDWIFDIPITETAQRLSQQVNNVIELVTKAGVAKIEVGIKVGETDELKRLRQYVDYLTEAAHQMEALADMSSRLGESSLGLTGSWQNVISDFSSMFEQLGKNIETTIAKGETGFDSWGKMAAQGIASVGTLLNALSDEQDTSSREGFESQKDYQIGATVMNTIAGVVNAWSSALAITPPIGPILGAANSATMIALGAIQIAKIKAAKFGGSTSVSNNAVASAINTPSQISNAVQNANIEAAVTDSKVYVVESDIQAVGNKVSVQETENRY